MQRNLANSGPSFRQEVFNHRDRAKQLCDFSGLQFGTIGPTDIDAFVEFRDVLFVLIEVKRSGIAVPFGQGTALTRLCSAVDGTMNKSGIMRTAPLLIVEHDTRPSEDIKLADLRVAHCFYRGKWYKPRESITTREAIEMLVGRHASFVFEESSR